MAVELSPAALFQQTVAANPDVLLMPEQKTARYFTYIALRNELRGGFIGTPEAIRAIYPNGLSAIYVPDGDADTPRAALVSTSSSGQARRYSDVSRLVECPCSAEITSIYDEAER